MSWTYLLIDIGAVSVPLLFSFHPRLAFHRRWRAAIPAILITAIPFLLWDMWFTGKGLWGFNAAYLSGWHVFNLPVEEVLFFICIPYACLFTYHCLGLWLGNTERSWSLWPSLGFMVLLPAAAIGFWTPYALVTFFLLAVFIAALQFIWRVPWLGRFYITYAVLIIPFTAVNGPLTGMGMESPVVWYSDAAIMGIRLWTIPAEDIFYGMLLILANVSIYERLGN